MKKRIGMGFVLLLILSITALGYAQLKAIRT